MNQARMVLLLSGSAVVLLAANWGVRVLPPRNGATVGNERAAAAVQASPPVALDATTNASKPPMEAADPAKAGRPKFSFDWSSVETTDYRQYAANLRAMGLPEELVRSMVIADIGAVFAPQEQKLQKPQVVHDGSWNERQGTWETNEWDRILKLREVQMAEQSAIKEVLGVYESRPIVRTPRGANYEAYEYAIGLLPEEKRLAVQAIVEQEIVQTGMGNDPRLSSLGSVETYRALAAERQAALKQILTPEEFDLYERSTTPCGTELARQVIGMEPNDQEFTTMFDLAYKCWQDSGGVYGWWHALGVPATQIQAAQDQLQTDLKAALGPDRYLDYQMAASSMGQQLQALAARYDLPRETVAQAFDLQRQIDWLDKGPASVRQVGNGLIPPPTMPTDKSREALDRDLRQVLGGSVWEAWQDGRNRQVLFDPLK
jgi:hypothetical protein